MQTSHSPSETESSPPESGDRKIPLDLVAGLVLGGIAAFFLLASGEGTLDWIFPSTLGYGSAIVAVVLVLRGLLGFGKRVPRFPSMLSGPSRDVAVFIVIMAGYVLLIRPLGFWPASAITIFVAAAYLAPRRSRRNVTIAVVAALVVVVLAYLLLVEVFYVAYPRARWLPFRL